MQASTTFKRDFLRLMLRGLDGARGRSDAAAGAEERRRLIKASADAAMAVARGARRAGWCRALLHLGGGPSEEADDNKKKQQRCCKLRSCTSRSANNKKKKNAAAASASVVARRMTRRRTQALRKIVPGGQSLNSVSLLSETVDYVIHLRAQVSLMQCLAKALGASNLKSQMSVEFKKARVCGLGDGTN